MGSGRGRHERHGRHDLGPRAQLGTGRLPTPTIDRPAAHTRRGGRGPARGRIGSCRTVPIVGGATEAVGEVGGFSVTLPNGRRIYPIQTGEKGLAWLTAALAGTAGHGSLISPDNPVARLTVGLADCSTTRSRLS